MATDPSHNQERNVDHEYSLVYRGICAVAAHCDGAIADDTVGFNGQDTKFGRRIAALSFEEWTPEIRQEAARIANVYRQQILAYTGIDVTTLSVVQAAKDGGTNHGARQQARNAERRQAAQAGRIVDASSTSFTVQWRKGDPDFDAFYQAVRGLPGRQWSGREWIVPASVEAADAVETAFEGFQQTPAVAALIARIRDEAAQVAARTVSVAAGGTQTAPATNRPANITLEPNGRQVRIKFDYHPDAVAAVRSLPGRSYQGGDKSNLADLHPDVLTFAERFNYTVDQQVIDALADTLEAHKVAQDAGDLNEHVSRLADPTAVPAEFVEALLASGAKVEVLA